MTSDPADAKRAYIGLGSNLANPEQQVLRAVEALAELSASRFVTCSSLYRSTPMTGGDSPAEQPDFINAVAAIDTFLPALALLDNLQELETRHGRERLGAHWGPRILDLDLLMYGDQIIETPRLMVPHAGMREREFVLYPLAEIQPDLRIPSVDGTESLTELLQNCPLRGLHKLAAKPEGDA